MSADKGKRARVEEDSEPIDGELVVAIEKLQEIQEQLDKIEEEVAVKLIEVEKKYNVIRRPSYIKRNKVIESIPDFWSTAFLNHPALGGLLNEDDQKVFKYLKTIDVEDSTDVKSGFTITFTFSPNPYFENEKLVKSYAFEDGDGHSTGTTINWKEGNDITKCAEQEKKGKKRSRSQLEETFFDWFGSSSEEDLLEGNGDEIADIIKEDLWPNPLSYFNKEDDEDEEDVDGYIELGDDDDEDDEENEE